jgi:polyisoprenyl-phosphate glycosyltransferase
LVAGQIRPVYSFVVPLFNEEASLPILLHRLDKLASELDAPAEIILVDDGSTDTTGIVAAARAKDDPRYRYLALSRNFGHQIAITAGMDHAAGDAVIVMDADLQDPPEVVPAMISKWKEGFEIVNAQRLHREGETKLKLWTAAAFYWGIRKLTSVDIPANVGDFRLIDRKAIDAFRAMPERQRFVRGMFSWLGFRQTVVTFRRPARAAGATKYTWLKMFRLALDAVVGFSEAPLRLSLWIGALVSLSGVGYGLYIMVRALTGAHYVSGWASTVVLVTLLSGLNFLMTGIIGVYVGAIHSEIKRRPVYVVGRAVGFDAAAPALSPAANIAPQESPVRRAIGR